MSRRRKLNERQLAVLRWVAEEPGSVTAANSELAATVYALRNRRLVTTVTRAGRWVAEITDAGRHYLEQGRYPEAPATGARAPVAPGILSPEALIKRVLAGGGTLRIENPDKDTRAAYRRVVHAAKATGAVPAGHHLRHTGRDSGDLVIQLADDANPDETSWNRVRLARSREFTDVGAVVTALRDDPASVRVSADHLSRALAVLQTIADEVTSRGHRLAVPRKRKHPVPHLHIRGSSWALTIGEERDKVPHQMAAEEKRRSRRGYVWPRIPTHDEVPSGRLRLEARRSGCTHGGPDQHWADMKQRPLEKQIKAIVRAFEDKADVNECRRLEAQKQHEEWLAQQARENAEREARWAEAIKQARQEAVQAYRRRTFADALGRRLAAEEIREFCDLLERRAADDGTTADHDLARWIAWGREQADHLDPVTSATGLAGEPFTPEPTADELRPYLGDWSPHRPERESRPPRPPSEATGQDMLRESWRQRRGRQWWRR